MTRDVLIQIVSLKNGELVLKTLGCYVSDAIVGMRFTAQLQDLTSKHMQDEIMMFIYLQNWISQTAYFFKMLFSLLSHERNHTLVDILWTDQNGL